MIPSSAPHQRDDRQAQAEQTGEADEASRFAQDGMSWLWMLVASAGIMALVLRGRFQPSIIALGTMLGALFLLHNAICIAAARIMGVAEIEEIGIWLGPAVIWRRTMGVLVRVNLLPIGGYVRLRQGDQSQYATLRPLERAAVIICAPVFFTLAGWCICAAIGMADAPVRAAAWVISPQARSIDAWCAQFAGFLAGLETVQGIVRAIGILMLLNGLLNLMPLPPLAGGMAIHILLEPLLGRDTAAKLLNGIGLLGLAAMALLCIAGAVIFVRVVFGAG